jgi:hypothetical protein|tara:strand:- start:1368 stop:1769 length:402 start_codon:yes stop_codon:yes gene_type:complete
MSLVASLIGPVSGLLDKVIEDKDQKAKLAHELATMADKLSHEQNLAQIAVNKEEAASGSLFKGGWRPCVGWVCAIAFFYHFVGQPVIVFVLTVTGVEIPDLPNFNMNTLLTVLGGMLGIGGLRSYEKQKGLTK